jgi:hypothetical protein
MADTKRGREEQARNEDRRQREREIEQARERADEPEPTVDRDVVDPETRTEQVDSPDDDRPCRRRDCDRRAVFLVVERYLEETSRGAVEATAELCREHTAEESPTHLEDAYAEYVFRVEPLDGIDFEVS